MYRSPGDGQGTQALEFEPPAGAHRFQIRHRGSDILLLHLQVSNLLVHCLRLCTRLNVSVQHREGKQNPNPMHESREEMIEICNRSASILSTVQESRVHEGVYMAGCFRSRKHTTQHNKLCREGEIQAQKGGRRFAALTLPRIYRPLTRSNICAVTPGWGPAVTPAVNTERGSRRTSLEALLSCLVAQVQPALAHQVAC